MALQSIININVDFYDKKYILINAKQLDKRSRFLSLTCHNHGEPCYFNEGEHSAYIRYKKPDNKSVFNFCQIDSKGKIIVELTEQMLVIEGISYADLVIVNKGGAKVNSETGEIVGIENSSILSTMPLYIDVTGTAVQCSEIESSYEFDGLNIALERAEAEYSEVIKTSKSWAVGDTGIREGEDTDNSKYYADAARKSAAEAAGSAEQAWSSALYADEMAMKAQSSADDAKKSEDAAREYSETSASNAEASNTHMIEASHSADEARASESAAKASEDAAKASYEAAVNSEVAAYEYELKAQNSAASAGISEENAKKSEENAKKSEDAAKISAEGAANSAAMAYDSEVNASQSELNAQASALDAKASADAAREDAFNSADNVAIVQQFMSLAEQSAQNAANSESAAANSANAAKASAEGIEHYATVSRSYAVGDTTMRPNEAVDNAKYYCEQAMMVAVGLNGGLLPMGTIAFEMLPHVAKQPGFMYNISNEFVSTSEFKDGGNYDYTAGTNVYWTADGYWDCLAGNSFIIANVDEVKDYLGIYI